MRLTLDSYVLEQLLKHATSEASLVRPVDGSIPDALGDHVDTIVHGLTEILGRVRVLARHDKAGPVDRTAYNGSPMRRTPAGGAS